jgi:hypothetical protein
LTSTQDLLKRLKQYVRSEAKAQHNAIKEQWSQPLAVRVAKGWAIEGVSVVSFQNRLLELHCETNNSRFREGDFRGNPQNPYALHLELEYDGETELEASLMEGNELLIAAKPSGWIIDQDILDLSPFYLNALNIAADSLRGRTIILPLLQNTLQSKIDYARYERTTDSLANSGLNESQIEAIAQAYSADLLHNEITGENPWGISFSTMFHMSNDSHLFKTDPGPEDVRLYEAKLFWHYDHRWAPFENGDARDVNYEEKTDPSFLVNPRYWVPKKEVEQRLENWPNEWFISFRDITNATNERSLVVSFIPRVGVSNKAPLFLLDQKFQPLQHLFFVCACNSLVVDYSTRQKIGGTSLNFYIAKQLPIIDISEIDNKHYYRFLYAILFELIYTCWDLNPFATHMGLDCPPFQWDEERRAILRAELDAYYARLYGLNRKQLRFILDPADLTEKELEDILDPWEEVADPLDPAGYEQRAAASTFPGETFRVLKEKEIRQHGEYRTRRLVLAA